MLTDDQIRKPVSECLAVTLQEIEDSRLMKSGLHKEMEDHIEQLQKQR
jgi:hypothetical protein